MSKNKFFVTTPIYYVNDSPHIGHAYTTLAADILSRHWAKILGEENTFFLTGTDEHGQKIVEAATEKQLTPKELVDSISRKFKQAWKILDIDFDCFIRTTDPRHKKIVQQQMQKAYNKGYIYKDKYKGLYCVGCEKYLKESDLVKGKCPLHRDSDPIYQEEDNYFLKLSEISETILEKIENKDYLILPSNRRKEIISRLKQGIEDISISRAGVDWGIPVTWDKDQTYYVWIDALWNYYSATQFVKSKEKFWPADLHIIGKDILWFHTVVWQALLIACDLDFPKKIFAHGFFTIDGEKMSKSLKNVIAPGDLVKRYGVDGARYLIISAYEFGADGDISLNKFDRKYNSDLANGLGNFISRVTKLASDHDKKFEYKEPTWNSKEVKNFKTDMENYRFVKYINGVTDIVNNWNERFNKDEPWKMDKVKQFAYLNKVIKDIARINFLMESFTPTFTEKARKIIGEKILPAEPLFPRI